MHEATHTSLDAEHLHSAGWRAAMAADGIAISEYARDHPDREDLAETVGPYLAATFRRRELGEERAALVERLCKHRFRYLNRLGLALAPLGTAAIAGSCSCGAAAFAVLGRPWGALVCHCSMCGSCPVTWLGVPRCTWRGPVERHRLSPFAERGLCGECGDRLYIRYAAEAATDWVELGTVRRGLPDGPDGPGGRRWRPGDGGGLGAAHIHCGAQTDGGGGNGGGGGGGDDDDGLPRCAAWEAWVPDPCAASPRPLCWRCWQPEAQCSCPECALRDRPLPIVPLG